MVLREIETQLSSCRRAVSKSMRVRYSGSVHARATIRAPFAVIQASSACSVNSPTKFSGMSAFRLSTISSAAAHFSSDAGASLVLANVSSLGKGRLMQKINR
jgi:hypothetical protein